MQPCYSLQTGGAGNVMKVILRLDRNVQPHAQTALLTFTVVVHCGHTFVQLFSLLASASISYVASYQKERGVSLTSHFLSSAKDIVMVCAI